MADKVSIAELLTLGYICFPFNPIGLYTTVFNNPPACQSMNLYYIVGYFLNTIEIISKKKLRKKT